jgi:transposase
VLDVQPKLGARVRLLAAGDTNKNDPNDARSVAVAALRSTARREVKPDGHAAVLKVWSKRHRDLGRTRTQVACRLHAVLCELVPGGISKEITAAHAAHVLETAKPLGVVEMARCELAADFLEDLRRIDAQMRDTKKKLTAAVRASGTTTTEIFGVGPIVAGTVIGCVVDASRFGSRDHFAAYNGTAPIEVSSGNRKIHRLSRRGNRRLNHAIHIAAVTQIRHRHSGGRAYYDRKLAAGKTHKEALRSLKRRVSDAIFARSRPTPAGPPQRPAITAREGNRGTTLSPARPACTPGAGSSAKPLPDLNPHYDPLPSARAPSRRSEVQRTLERPLDTKRLRSARFGRGDVLCSAAARNRRFCGGIPSCPAAAHLECGRIARSRRGGCQRQSW